MVSTSWHRQPTCVPHILPIAHSNLLRHCHAPKTSSFAMRTHQRTTLAFACILAPAVGYICNALVPHTYEEAWNAYPPLRDAIDAIKGQAIATWHTDRGTSELEALVAQCDEDDDAVPAIVLYGLPGKDCAGEWSSGGTNTNADQYRTWVDAFTQTIGDREIVLVLEPDAVGLLSTNDCAWANDYLPNLQVALELLTTQSPNAHVYVDVASWSNQAKAIDVLNDLRAYGLGGLSLNTANYKATDDLYAICDAYAEATDGLHCILDTSRNYNGSPHGEWCNARSAGIGAPPTDWVDNDNVDYLLWIKVPGESDGECTHAGRTDDAMAGPAAGLFFPEAFEEMWNKGYFVQEAQQPGVWSDLNAAPERVTTANDAVWRPSSPAPNMTFTPQPTRTVLVLLK
ncbi:Aste57867_12794 [Aphanomyces stellatus]|uniref:Aste57867_12794 protein n=1 Tax=Aphanomyces stellatus TaxID=120398 RepID=A0A485KWI1_9STRA|nr:hypothetical protein As57867_012746 [Aphanomyces stellatus]VFT89643.1 Aste57867_12794 [Aphanomyces stellatus]